MRRARVQTVLGVVAEPPRNARFQPIIPTARLCVCSPKPPRLWPECERGDGSNHLKRPLSLLAPATRSSLKQETLALPIKTLALLISP